MKNKLLLIALPALMVLSSCARFNSTGNQQKDNLFKEEASACLDVFGGGEEISQLRRKEPLRSAAADMAEPIIGVQYRAVYEEDKDGDGTPEQYVAVRFIAAIKTLDVNVTWTRNIYKDDGTKYHDEATFPTTKAYTSLNSNSSPVLPSSFGAGYNYFVAYSLYDIPFESVDDYCIVAYVTLSDTIEPAALPEINSKAMAARIGGGTAKFDLNQTGYFLTGIINGTPGSIVAKDAVTSDGDKARFTVPLAANDSFVGVNNDTANSKFFIYDYSKIQSGGSSASFESDDFKIKAKNTGIFIFYVNGSDRLWTDQAPELYINGVKTDYSNIRTDGTDKVKCTIQGLKANDVIRFKTGEDYLHFYHTDGTDLDDGDSYTLITDGDYTFFVTSTNKVFYNPVYYSVELTFDFSAVTSWADTFKIHAWGASGDLHTWGSSEESIIDNKYSFLSDGKITHFIVYFRDKGTGVTKESTTIDYGFNHGHSYTITVAPADWGNNENANRFYSGVNVVDDAD